ncbi:MAG: hypothetical protein ABJF05_07690 [Paracoccaceae bacterium]
MLTIPVLLFFVAPMVVFGANGCPIALDLNGDGFLLDMRNIDFTKPLSGHDLFGTAAGFLDGFEKFRELDADGNGEVSGDELSEVAIWQDDGDAVFEEQELKNLPDFGIYSIVAVPVEVPGKDNQPLLVSKALSGRGEMYVEDVWLLDTENIWTRGTNSRWLWTRLAVSSGN